MRKLLIVILLLLLPMWVMAAERTTEWDPVEEDNILGYTMYKTVDPEVGPWVKMNEEFITATTHTFDEIEGEPRQFYVVTASNPWGESGHSNIVTPRPGKPQNIHMVIDGAVNLVINGPVTIEQ